MPTVANSSSTHREYKKMIHSILCRYAFRQNLLLN